MEISLKPVTHITADAIGPPGKRVFYIQGWKDDQVVSLIIEKFQLQNLVIAVEQFFAGLYQRLPNLPDASAEFDEDKMHIHPPVEPLFRIAEMGLAYDPDTDLIALIAREAPSEEAQAEQETNSVAYWCTRSQMRSMTHWIMEVSSRGRPLCEQCGEPMDPEGHFCARKNGHRH